MPKGVPNKRYTPEFKRMVVETIEKENLSIRAAMQEFGINDHAGSFYSPMSAISPHENTPQCGGVLDSQREKNCLTKN